MMCDKIQSLCNVDTVRMELYICGYTFPPYTYLDRQLSSTIFSVIVHSVGRYLQGSHYVLSHAITFAIACTCLRTYILYVSTTVLQC